MSESPPHGVSWHVYVDRRLEDFREQMDERFRAQQEAVRAYAEANQRALEKVNEFRASLTDQNQRFATSDTIKGIDGAIERLTERISELERTKARLEGQAIESAATTRTMMAILGLGVVVFQIILTVVFRVVWK